MRNKKILSLFVMLTLSLFVFTDCKQETDKSSSDLTALLLVIRSRNSGTLGTKAQLRQASAARSAGKSSAGAARSAGRTAFNINIKDGMSKKELMAFLQYKAGIQSISDKNQKSSRPSTRMTAVTCKTDTGGACTDTSELIVLSGTDTTTCKSGTLTLANLTTALTGADLDSLVVDMTDGEVSFANCSLDVPDFLNYPATSRVTMGTGSKVKPRGTYTLTDSFDEATETATTITVEDITVNGSVIVGGDTITLEDLRTVTNLKEINTLSDLIYIKANGTKLLKVSSYDAGEGVKDDYSDVFGISGVTTVSGNLTSNGKINGETVNAPLAFSDKKITWKVLCSKAWSLMTDDDWESDSICTYTVE